MNYQDTTSTKSLETLTKLSQIFPEHASTYTTLSTHLEKKLYHPLTVTLYTFCRDASNVRSMDNNVTNFDLLYQDVVMPIHKKVNPLSLGRIAALVAVVRSSTDPKGAVDLLQTVVTYCKEEWMDSHLPGKVYTEAKLYLLKLSHVQATGGGIDAELQTSLNTFLKKNHALLVELSKSTESELAVAHSAYYETAMELYKLTGPAEKYYSHALQYLHYTPLATLEPKVQYALARDMCLAALTGKGIYDFGQIVYHPANVLEVLKGTELEWLVQIMDLAIWGKVEEWTKMKSTHGAVMEQQVALQNRLSFVEEKIALLALVHMVFERESGSKTISFEQVAERVQIQMEQVELFLIRALSLELIKGTMDQVDGTVDVTWVMPRVLDDANVKELAGRFKNWIDKTGAAREFMDEHQPAFS